MAIEIEFPDNGSDLRRVEYRPVFAHMSFEHPLDTETTAEQILLSKYLDWSYEQELRILQSNTWYQLPTPAKRVIAGHRMDPAVFEALRLLCEKLNIDLRRTAIGDDGIDADYVPPLAKTPRERTTRRRSKVATAGQHS